MVNSVAGYSIRKWTSIRIYVTFMLYYLLQDYVVSQITLINGEKIWVREEKGPSWSSSGSTSSANSNSSYCSDDCNSSTDSINICVPLFVSTNTSVHSELDLSSEIMDLNSLLNQAPQVKEETTQVLLTKPTPASIHLVKNEFGSPTPNGLSKPGNSLLRNALTGKTSYLMTKQQANLNKPLPTFRPGSESSKIGEQKVEEILLLAKKRTLETSTTTNSTIPNSHHSFGQVGGPKTDKLVINTANLLNTAASQLNLAPPNLSSLVPIKSNDTNNNIKSIGSGPPPNVISLVVDVGNNNNNNNSVLSTMDQEMIDSPSKKRILKRQKSSSSTSSSGSTPMQLSAFSIPPEHVTHHSPTTVSGGQLNNQVNEPRKEARLLHYCPICNKGFKDRYSVNVHVRTHTGEKPFSCALCGKCFRQKAHLAKHHQTHAAKQNTGPNGLIKNSDTTTISQGSKQTVVHQHSGSSSAVSHLNAEEKIVFPLSPVSVEIMDHT